MCLLVAMQSIPAAEAVGIEGGRSVQLAGLAELTIVTLLVCIAAVGVWELLRWLLRWALGIREEFAKERRLRRLRDLAKTAAQEELDRECLRREIELESEAWRRPWGTTSSEPSAQPRTMTRTTVTQTLPTAEPETRVETRVVYRDMPVPDEVPVGQFWKTTDHRSKVHTNRDCHGLRNAGTVFLTEYCNYCEGKRPLYTRAR